MPGATLVREGTDFVGRSRELAELQALFSGDVRLVSVVGAPGSGKTRLARQFGGGHSRVDASAEGNVRFCDLTHANTRDEIIGSVARALGVTPTSRDGLDDPVSFVGSALAGHRAPLVILDNFEQLVEHAGSTVGRWIEQAPAAKFLVTSQRNLDLQSERMVELGPLCKRDAIDLFFIRARAVRRDAVDRPEDQQAVEELVRHLDCMPLAIELAAARVGVLSPRELLERLSQRLQLLRAPGARVAGKHATLETAIAWSWSQLSPWEQSALAQCAVFAGSFSLGAAERVIDLLAHSEAPPLIDVVQELRQRSLVWTSSDERRSGLTFGLYESIRFFAAARLEELCLREEAEQRHAIYFLDVAEQCARSAYGPDAPRAIAWLIGERENLVAVQRRFADREPALAVRAALALEPALALRGPASVLLEQLDASASLVGTLEDAGLEGRTLAARGDALAEVGRLDAAARDLNAALPLIREAGDARAEARVLMGLAKVSRQHGHGDGARELLGRALTLARAAHDRASEGIVLARLGFVNMESDRNEEAERQLLEALAIHQHFGDRFFEANVHCSLGATCLMLNKLDEAEHYLERAAALARELHTLRAQGLFLCVLTLVDIVRNDVERGLAHAREALTLSRCAGHRWAEGATMLLLAVLEAARDDVRAAREGLALAREVVRGMGDKRLAASAELMEGFVDLAEARLARARGNDATAFCETAARRITELTEQIGASAPWPSYVRLTVVTLQAVIERTRAMLPGSAGELEPLRVEAHGLWFAVGSEKVVDLRRRGPTRRVLRVLVERRQEMPGTAVAVYDLVDVGWPGENIPPDSAARRLYVTISGLRKMGLGSILITRDDGYLLDPDVPLKRVAAGSRSAPPSGNEAT